MAVFWQNTAILTLLPLLLHTVLLCLLALLVELLNLLQRLLLRGSSTLHSQATSTRLGAAAWEEAAAPGDSAGPGGRPVLQ